jgi:hypothetical protein
MGSGNSKLNPEGEAVPAKLRPFLRRWFDEIRRRKDSNLSKKELLVHEGVEEYASSQPLSQHENERKSMTSTSDESVARSSKVEDEKSNVVHVPAESDKTSKEVKERHEDEEKCEKKDEKDLAGKGEGKEEEKEVKVVEKAVVVEEVLVVVQETMEEEDDEEEEEGDEDEKFTFGSPSFRVYCIPSTENNKEESKYLESLNGGPYIYTVHISPQTTI